MKFNDFFKKWFRWKVKQQTEHPSQPTIAMPATHTKTYTMPIKSKPELVQVLTYSGDDVIGHSEMEIPVGTVVKITATKKQPVGFRNKKFRVVFCEKVSDNAEFYTVNLKSAK